MKRMRAVAVAAVLGLVAVFPAVNAPSAEAHGWVTSPPSRQDNCSTGKTSFDCGKVKYEPQSVEAPKGSLQCSGGDAAFAVLDDNSKPWPVTNVGSELTLKWKLTAQHRTSLWEYFVDGKLHQTYDAKNTKPDAITSHKLTNLPAGKHKILARWNVADTPMAFYSCVDINVGGTTNPDPTPTNTPTPNPTTAPPVDPTPGTSEATPWSAATAYTTGKVVSYQGQNYKAKWWTQGDNPASAGEWGVWAKVGSSTPVDPTNPPVDPTDEPTGDTTTPPVDPTNPPVDPTPGTCAAAPWNATASYTSGKTVSYKGNTYTAKWWTQGEDPSAGGVWTKVGPCAPVDPVDPTDPPVDPTDEPTDDTTTTPNPNPGSESERLVGYFTNWGIYGRNYQVKNIVTSGSAKKLTHILYAFGNVQNGKCTIGDAYADYDKAFTAAESVDGVADTWDQPLRGNFNQLRKLKKINPDLKILWSFGGWTWSGGFGEASKNPAAFAKSCRDLVEDPRWADVFDGIDIDWEYPNACGLTCDTSGQTSFSKVIKALRVEFGKDLITAATTADGTKGGKLEAADYGEAAKTLDWIMPMTYDFMGPWDKTGPTAPHSALQSYTGIPIKGYDSKTAIDKLKSFGVPSDKILLGIGFYGRGWTGVTQSAPGGTATGAAAGTYEAGIEDYRVLKNTCPATGVVGGTAYGFCGGNWWGYDTPATLTGKMKYAKDENLGGAFFWELSGDTANGELISAMSAGLKK